MDLFIIICLIVGSIFAGTSLYVGWSEYQRKCRVAAQAEQSESHPVKISDETFVSCDLGEAIYNKIQSGDILMKRTSGNSSFDADYRGYSIMLHPNGWLRVTGITLGGYITAEDSARTKDLYNDLNHRAQTAAQQAECEFRQRACRELSK